MHRLQLRCTPLSGWAALYRSKHLFSFAHFKIFSLNWWILSGFSSSIWVRPAGQDKHTHAHTHNIRRWALIRTDRIYANFSSSFAFILSFTLDPSLYLSLFISRRVCCLGWELSQQEHFFSLSISLSHTQTHTQSQDSAWTYALFWIIYVDRRSSSRESSCL